MLQSIENKMAFFSLKEEEIISFSLFFIESVPEYRALENTWNTNERKRKYADGYWLLYIQNTYIICLFPTSSKDGIL